MCNQTSLGKIDWWETHIVTSEMTIETEELHLGEEKDDDKNHFANIFHFNNFVGCSGMIALKMYSRVNEHCDICT